MKSYRPVMDALLSEVLSAVFVMNPQDVEAGDAEILKLEYDDDDEDDEGGDVDIAAQAAAAATAAAQASQVWCGLWIRPPGPYLRRIRCLNRHID